MHAQTGYQVFRPQSSLETSDTPLSAHQSSSKQVVFQSPFDLPDIKLRCDDHVVILAHKNVLGRCKCAPHANERSEALCFDYNVFMFIQILP
jgi:hypothetical protein